MEIKAGLYIIEEIFWGTIGNEGHTPSILHRFDTPESRQEFLDSRKSYQFAYQHKIICWDAFKSEIQPEQILKKEA